MCIGHVVNDTSFDFCTSICSLTVSFSPLHTGVNEAAKVFGGRYAIRFGALPEVLVLVIKKLKLKKCCFFMNAEATAVLALGLQALDTLGYANARSD